MSEFTTHLRKDVKLLTSDSLLVVLILLLAIMSFVIALTTSSSYIGGMRYGYTPLTPAMMEESQKQALINYWSTVGGLFMVVFSAAAAMAMSVEKGSGMSGYVLTFRVRKPLFYLSKLLVLIVLVLVALFIALAAYLIVFSFMDMPMLDAGSLAASMLFPLLSMLVFASLGLALSTLASRKGAVVAVAVVLFVALTAVLDISMGMGITAAQAVEPQAGPGNYTEYMPLENKLLIYGNPVVLAQGTVYLLGGEQYGSPIMYDAAGGVALGLGFIVVFTLLGLLSFSRERVDRGLVSGLLSRLRRTKGT